MLRAAFMALVAVACVATAQEAVVWVASPWQHVLMSTPPGPAREVTLRAARNEYEPFRVIVRSGERALRDVNLQASALSGPAGDIPADSIALYREHYIDVFEPSPRSKAHPGWYPDPLIPFVDPQTGTDSSGSRYDAVPFDLMPDANQGVWGDIYVPGDAAPGRYTGKITVTCASGKLAEVPIALSVWDFALPHSIAMQSCFGGLGGRLAKGLDMDAGSEEFRQVEDLCIDEMLRHRCVPSSLGNIWPKWTPEGGLDDTETAERLRAMVEDKHVNALRMPFSYRDDPAKCKAYLGALAEYLKGKGWLDLAYIYMRDEPNNKEQYETVRQQGALIKAAHPGIGRMCTEQTITSNPEWGDLYGAVDIWCPLWGLWDEKTALERQKLGERMWSYTALCQCAEQNPFWQIDFPPVSFRAPMWVSWHYDIEGFLYWSSIYWTVGHDVWTRPHFRDRYWGEGMLLYPGAPAGVRGVVTSIRLKLIREAMEDFEYMTMAAARHGREKVDEVVDTLTRSFTDWERDPQAYVTARDALAAMIVGQ